MTKTLLILLLCCFYGCKLQAQHTLDWLSTLGSGGEEIITKIEADNQGNVYGIGHFQDTINGTVISNGFKDIFVCKYASNGSLLWLLKMGGTDEDLGKDLALGEDGMLYITGSYRNTFYYGNDSLINSGGTDAFVAKIDSQGTILWVKQIGSSRSELGTAITCDAFGNSYIGGTYEDSLWVDNQPLASYGALNNFLLKLDANGQLLWHNTLGTPTFDNIRDLELDAAGNLYLIGSFRDVASSSLGQLFAYGNADVLLAKLDVNGQWFWWKKMGSTLPDFGFTLHIDGNALFLAGVFQDTAYFDATTKISEGEFDAFLAKCDAQGAIQWVQHVAGIDDSNPYDIKTLANNHILLTGYFEGKTWSGQDSIASRNPRHVPSDLFIAEYDATGGLLYLNQLGSRGDDWGASLAIVDSNCFYLAGVFQDSVYFDSTSLEISQSGSLDAFIAKWSPTIFTDLVITSNFKQAPVLLPNLVQKETVLSFELQGSAPVTISCYNRSGQCVERIMHQQLCNGPQELTWNTKGLPAGLYYMTLQMNQAIVSLPFTIVR